MPDEWPYNFTSSWTFPPPLSHDFFVSWVLSSSQTNETESTNDMIKAAVGQTNAPTPTDFGNPDIELRVGDVVVTDWADSSPRTLSLNCMVCNEGRNAGSAPRKGAGIVDACENWTSTSHISNFPRTSTSHTPNSPFAIPDSLSDIIALSPSAVALCIFSLEQGLQALDWSVPFPVLNSGRVSAHWRFSATQPRGEEDWSILSSPSSAAGTDAGEVTGDGEGKNQAGIIVGVLFGIGVVSGVLIWWYQRRKRANGGGGGEEAAAARASEGRELQVLPMQTHRPVGGAREEPPPPTYHEALRGQKVTEAEVERGRYVGPGT
ncbi:hypothetical protein EJ04DRAFT_512354 [Polyplosphaeria fusca]|uniref:Uncharacterized protein n=1 Tax=Polyplosphaeria fusca TaxID=682080 RepID=A0A9P4R0R7_9PLEO|nr:hypothetical protein EJ04DRAFT_512354 [Polyplosphaeria fusca]